jgi:hypothetical protein
MKVLIELGDLREVLKHVDMREIGNDPSGKKFAAISRVFAAAGRATKNEEKAVEKAAA